MPNAIYLRKSRAEELSQSTDEVLAGHRAALLDLADRQGILIADIYEEVVSGESLHARLEMQKLLKKVEAGEYDAVLCMDIDRLGRGGMADQGVILDAFRYSETLIVTPDKVYDLSTEIDQETTEMKAFFARWEYRMIRKRMRRGLMQCVEAGGYVANPPYGYRKCTVGKLPSLEIVEEEAAFVRLIYDRYLHGIGAERIAAELNALGSVPRRGAQWNRNTVRHILRNPTFKGMVAWNRVRHYHAGAHGQDRPHVVYNKESEWLLYPGLHPAIISPEDWQRVQEIRTSRYIPPNYTGQRVNPFAGLVKCGVCGKNIQLMKQHGGPRMLCTQTGCSSSCLVEHFETAFLDMVSRRLERLKLEAAENNAPGTDDLRLQLQGIQKQLEKLSGRVTRLYEFLEDGTYDRSTFRSRMEALEAERGKLLQMQADTQQRMDEVERMDLTRAADELDAALKLYPTLSPAEKNTLLKSLFTEIRYFKSKKTKPRDFSLTITPRYFVW